MGTRALYQIPFSGLKDGVHLQEFVLTADFFRQFKTSGISEGDVLVNVQLDKIDQNNLTLHFAFKGSVEQPCNRCLVALEEKIEKEYQIQVKLTDNQELLKANEIDILYLPATTTSLELDQLFYEYLHLALPIVITCDEKKIDQMPCDTQILERLNIEENREENVDPRWKALEQLKK